LDVGWLFEVGVMSEKIKEVFFGFLEDAERGVVLDDVVEIVVVFLHKAFRLNPQIIIVYIDLVH
jgi:hypothetical protein